MDKDELIIPETFPDLTALINPIHLLQVIEYQETGEWPEGIDLEEACQLDLVAKVLKDVFASKEEAPK